MRRRAIIGKSKAPAVVSGGFKMQIQTTTANQSFTLPTRSGYTYNATVLWGDGTQSSVTGHNINNSKTYATAGTYDIEIKGTFDAMYFNNSGSKDLVKKILSWGDSDFNGFVSLEYGFYGCSNLSELATGAIKVKSNSSEGQMLLFAFGDCTKITTIPDSNLLRNCTSATLMNGIFRNCKLTSLPNDLFKYNINATSFSSALSGTNLSALPSGLFQYNLAITSFSCAFEDNVNLTTLPSGLFSTNTLVTSVPAIFRNCTQLSSLPSNLFANNNLITSFVEAFSNCPKLQLRSDIFGATPNFGTRIMDFFVCFQRNTFTGIQGTAPALWSATMNASSTKTTCFGGAGNSATSLTNYASIPAAWK